MGELEEQEGKEEDEGELHQEEPHGGKKILSLESPHSNGRFTLKASWWDAKFF